MSECTSDECLVILNYVIPALGVVTAMSIQIAPFQSVRNAQSTSSLDKINVLPFPFLCVNSLAWFFYGILVNDSFVIGPNLLGFNLALYYSLACYPLAKHATQKLIQKILIGFCTYIMIGAFISFKVLHDAVPQAKTVLGLVCVSILIIFYSSPLSDMYNVIKKRDSSSIDLLLALATFANGSLWTIYGIAIADPFIWAPNAIGFLFSVIQLVLLALFRKKNAAGATSIEEQATLRPSVLGHSVSQENIYENLGAQH